MDNDTLLILKELYTNREVDAYELHVNTQIPPPTTLYSVLEKAKKSGYVTREDLVYRLTPDGESYLSSQLTAMAIKPETSFKEVPEDYTRPKVLAGDASVLNDIVQ